MAARPRRDESHGAPGARCRPRRDRSTSRRSRGRRLFSVLESGEFYAMIGFGVERRGLSVKGGVSGAAVEEAIAG